MAVSVLIVLLSVPVVAWTTYLATLAVLSCARTDGPVMTAPRTKFDVIVPAHNEERGIMATVLNLAAVDYPASLRRVIVVADNCTDATASRASEAGAMVLVRNDMSRRGKGYALAHAFERSLNEGFADAVVVVDADTKVTANLLGSFDARMCRGARAIQAEYKVANPESSWRTRLMHIGFTLFHDVRSRGRERLGVSAGLRGNGMAFSAPLLREIPHEAFSIVEDVEYGLRLGLAGHRIEYAGEAQVFGEMVSSEVSSRSQRRRWEGGRLALARRHATRLLVEGARRRSLMLLDLAADLLVPPLTYIVLAAALGLAASLVWLALGRGAWWAVVPWCAAWVGLAAYLARGLMLARAGPRVMVDLLWAPLYMVWKVVLAIRAPPRADEEWIRTAREEEKR